MVRLDLDPADIEYHAMYWLRFIRACASGEDPSSPLPWVVLVGSRALEGSLGKDEKDRREEAVRRLSDLKNACLERFGDSLSFCPESYALDCRLEGQDEMRDLIKALTARHAVALKDRTSPRLCEAIRGELASWRRKGLRMMEVADIAERLGSHARMKGAEALADSYLASDCELTHKALAMLHVEGDLIYEMGESLRNTVIIDPQWLCGDVLAALAAPPSWKGEDQLRQVDVGDDGVVTLEAIRTRFRKFDPHKMMTLLEVRRNAAGRPIPLWCHGSLLLIWPTPHLLTTTAFWPLLPEKRR